MAYCGACGAKLKPDDKVCSACGVVLAQTPPEHPFGKPLSAQIADHRKVIGIASAILVLGLLVFAVAPALLEPVSSEIAQAERETAGETEFEGHPLSFFAGEWSDKATCEGGARDFLVTISEASISIDGSTGDLIEKTREDGLTYYHFRMTVPPAARERLAYRISYSANGRYILITDKDGPRSNSIPLFPREDSCNMQY